MIAAPAPAAAAQRFAAPESAKTTGDCPRTAPCRLDHAAEGAAAGDEVIVVPGEHRVSATIEIAGAGIDVHGEDGKPRPRIVGTDLTPLVSLDGGSGAPLRFRHLELEHTADHAFTLEIVDGPVELNGLIVTATGLGLHALELAGSGGEILVRDTVTRVIGDSGAAIVARAADVELRNVTAIAPGKSHGLRVRGDCVPEPIVGGCSDESHAGETTARNVIASGGGSDALVLDDFGQSGTLRMSHSNGVAETRDGGTYVDEGANQAAEPRFADAAAGDFHQAPGSPTIDAGTADRLGGADLDGEARTLGRAPDIGADERAPDPDGGGGGGGGGQDGGGTGGGTTGGGGGGTPGGTPGPGPGDPGGGGGAPDTPDLTAPAVRGLRVVRRGTRLRLRVSEPATVTVTVEAGRRCRAGRRTCARYVRLRGRLRRSVAGSATLRLGRRLKPGGRYRVVVRAVDAAGNAAPVRRVAFRVPARRR